MKLMPLFLHDSLNITVSLFPELPMERFTNELSEDNLSSTVKEDKHTDVPPPLIELDTLCCILCTVNRYDTTLNTLLNTSLLVRSL
jgi:hypothetical protein